MDVLEKKSMTLFTKIETQNQLSGNCLPTMLKTHCATVNDLPSKLNQTHYQFAEEIKALRKEDFSLRNVPHFEEEYLKKGVTCVECGKFINEFTKKRSCVCSHCGKEELVSHTILRLARECRRLFPAQKFTVSLILKWCDYQISACRIRYVLNKYLKATGTGKWTYYEF